MIFAPMEKIEKSNFINNQQSLPEKPGTFSFYQKERLLFIGYSANLRAAVSAYFVSNPDDRNILQLISLTSDIHYAEKADLFEAFTAAKLLQNQKNTQFNYLIQPYKDYIYFAVDFHHPPFFKVMENTQDEHYYLGAFENRFLLFDFIDVLHRLQKLPNCPPDTFPCDLIKTGDCEGYCLKDNPEKVKMILDNYLFPDGTLVQELEAKQEQLMDHLEFIPAEIIRKQLRIIRKYYDRLKFMMITKDLNCILHSHEVNFQITGGLVSKMQSDLFTADFPNDKIEMRSNEALAIEKKDLAEAWLVYRKIKEQQPELIEKIYQLNREKLRKTLD